MMLQAHGDQTHRTSEHVGGVAEWDAMRVEPRHIGAGFRNGPTSQSTERIYILIGVYSVDRRPPLGRSPALDAKRLKRVLDFIEARFAGDVSLSDLAAQACLSPFHFSRLFHHATGLPPHRYVTRRRILAAQEMLAADPAPLVQVALAVGFETQASFTRAFRRNTGLTPGRYRQLYRR